MGSLSHPFGIDLALSVAMWPAELRLIFVLRFRRGNKLCVAAVRSHSPSRMSRQSCIPNDLVRRANRVLKRLADRKLTAITAESCTAGLVAASLSLADGASNTLHGSFVTYTKANKVSALGVPPALLKREGAVTRGVATAMLKGALRYSPADIAVAVTGVLGPEPDDDGNPVGLVYLGCQRRGRRAKVVRKIYGKKPSDTLRRWAVRDALRLLDESLR